MTTFERLRIQKRKALVVYLTAADPSADESVDIALAAIQNGADIIELGMAFSDPVADGPVIQKAMQRALSGGATFDTILQVARRIRQHSEIPLILFGYLNPLMYRGIENACESVRNAGMDGMLVVDLPAEEATFARSAATKVGLEWVTLVAPPSGKQRAAAVAQQATGFVYVVSMTGVTGGHLTDFSPAADLVSGIRSVSKTPICIGFGVRDETSAKKAAQLADGVVVGTAIVNEVEQGMAHGDCAKRVGAKVAELRRGVDGVGP